MEEAPPRSVPAMVISPLLVFGAMISTAVISIVAFSDTNAVEFVIPIKVTLPVLDLRTKLPFVPFPIKVIASYEPAMIDPPPIQISPFATILV